jgi:hypothetical protein
MRYDLCLCGTVRRKLRPAPASVANTPHDASHHGFESPDSRASTREAAAGLACRVGARCAARRLRGAKARASRKSFVDAAPCIGYGYRERAAACRDHAAAARSLCFRGSSQSGKFVRRCFAFFRPGVVGIHLAYASGAGLAGQSDAA